MPGVLRRPGALERAPRLRHRQRLQAERRLVRRLHRLHQGPVGAALLLDCDAGIKTWSEWARQLGLSGSDADGYINYQYTGNKKYLRNVSSAIYAWYKGCPGSPTVKAVQRRIGSKNVDGVWGAVDTENLKAYMREQWGYKMTTDGPGVFGANTAYNVQHSLNQGFWRQ